MRILTDFKRCPSRIEFAPGEALGDAPSTAPSTSVEFITCKNFKDFLQGLATADGIVLNGSLDTLFRLSALFLALPWLKKPLIAVDLVLRAPQTKRQRQLLPLKRLLLGQVDHFIHYFQDTREYERIYGLSRNSYVPFKSNIMGSKETREAVLTEEYIYTAGISQRDYAGFFEAIRGLPYPAAISEYSLRKFENRTANFPSTPEELPPNLKILSDAGKREDLVRQIAAAKVVVVPTLKSSLCASGISTYLDAMALGKCVVISHGPGVTELLKNEAILVPAEDPGALREAIRRVWEDMELRAKTAQAGQRYVEKLGTEQEFLHRVLERSCELIQGLPKKNGA